MKNLLKLEYLFAAVFFSILLVQVLDNNIFAFLALILLPDLGMLGYLINAKVGAYTYNLLHHQAIGYVFLTFGFVAFPLENSIPLIVGSLILAHSNLDRTLGYGLKRFKGFKFTHLGDL